MMMIMTWVSEWKYEGGRLQHSRQVLLSSCCISFFLSSDSPSSFYPSVITDWQIGSTRRQRCSWVSSLSWKWFHCSWDPSLNWSDVAFLFLSTPSESHYDICVCPFESGCSFFFDWLHDMERKGKDRMLFIFIQRWNGMKSTEKGEVTGGMESKIHATFFWDEEEADDEGGSGRVHKKIKIISLFNRRTSRAFGIPVTLSRQNYEAKQVEL